MAERQEPQVNTSSAGADDEDIGLPPTHDNNPELRSKKKGFKITQTKVYIGGFVVMVLVTGYVFFRNDPGEVPLPAGEKPSGGAEIEVTMEEYDRLSSEGGGVGQERAEVLAEIDDREALQERIESGRSAIRFGEPIEDEVEEPQEAPPQASVFGDVAPREPAAPQDTARSTPRVAPISGTVSPTVRPQAGGVDQTGINERIQYELELAESAYVTHQQVSVYRPTQASSNSNPHPITPELSRNAAEADKERADTRALPGDVTLAYLGNRISSDQPSGRVKIDILEGELRGGHMLGDATFEGERLLLNMDMLVFEGEVYDDVVAVAIDPETLDPSLQDGINRRLFTRYGVPVLMGLASVGIDYQAERRNPTVTRTNQETGETYSTRTNEVGSFGEYALDQSADSLKDPLDAIAQNAASQKAEAWANPGVIGLMFLTRVDL